MVLKGEIPGFGSGKERRKRGEQPLNLRVRDLYASPISFMLFFAFAVCWDGSLGLGTVYIGSQSFEGFFVLGLFCWITDSLRKDLTNFGSLSQPAELVGKPDQPVH